MKIVFCHDTKILVNNNFLYSSGGLNRNIILRYIKLSNEFSLLTRESHSNDSQNLSILGNMNQISFTAIPNFTSGSIDSFKAAYKIINEVLNDNDFIIIRLPSFIGLIAVYLALKKNKKHVIEIVGCAWDSYRLHSFKGKLIAFPFYYITKYLVKKATNVLYVTDNFLQKRYPSNSNNKIGCSDVELVIDDTILYKRFKKINLKSKDDYIKIGMIGFLEAKYKGFKTALKALKKIKKDSDKKYLLEIVGGGNPSYINSLITKFGLDNQVNIIGNLSHPTGIFDWLDSIDIFIQPSETEGMPRALIEAMSRACACIGSNAGEIPELLEFDYIHNKNDFKSLGQYILKLSNPILMKLNSENKFNKSKEFNKSILDKKRNKFYLESMKNKIKT